MNRQFRKYYKIFLSIMLFIVVSVTLFLTFYDKNEDKTEDAGKKTIKTVDAVNYSVDKEQSVEEVTTENDTTDFDKKLAIPVGEPIGIYVKTDGVMVVDTGEVTGLDGKNYTPCKDKLFSGDYIISVNGISVSDKITLVDIVNNCGKKQVTLGIRRGNSELYTTIAPVLGKSERLMLGLWVKDDISGIGTLTYITEESFGALGHSINDNDTGNLFDISDGAIFPAKIINIEKPDGEKPGRLEGLINYTHQSILGRVTENSKFGINGNVTEDMKDLYGNREWLPVGDREEIYKGNAYILSCISGEPVYYSIDIEKISYSDTENLMGMGLEIKVTDDRLMDMTGGIVQGMSGTPIIQNGKIIGAVTHVFLKNPAKGYGVFIEDMMGDN